MDHNDMLMIVLAMGAIILIPAVLRSVLRTVLILWPALVILACAWFTLGHFPFEAILVVLTITVYLIGVFLFIYEMDFEKASKD